MGVIQIHRDAAPGAIERVPYLRVYIKDAWTDAWRPVDYLEPLSATITSGAAIGRATFRYRTGRIKRADKDAFENVSPQWFGRKFIKIVRLLDGPADDSAGDAADRTGKEELLWIGFVDDQQFALHGTDAHKWTMDSMLVAYDLRILLQRQRLADAWAWDTIDDELRHLKFLPTFNRRASRAGAVAGNAHQTDGTPTGPYLFGNGISPTFWNNRNIIEYLLKWHGPHVDPSTNGQEPTASGNGSPLFTLGGQAVLPQHVVGVYGVEGRSLLEALGMLMDRRRGMGWCLVTDGEATSKVEIRVFSLLDETLGVGYTDTVIPANAEQVELDLSDDRQVVQHSLVVSESQSFERIRVVGQRIKSCFTVSFADGTLEKNWTDAQEAAYKSPGGADAEENDCRRGADCFERVFSHFRIPRNWNWMAGPGEGGTKQNANPSCDAQGNLQASPAGPKWIEGLTFLRQLPFYEDSAETPEGSRPELASPLALVKYGDRWHYVDRAADITVEPADPNEMDTRLPNGSLRMLDTELGLAVRFSPRHLMAANRWSGAGETSHEPVFAYEDILITVAVETPVRLEVVRTTGTLAGTGRELVIGVPDAEAWYVVPGTVKGLFSTGYLIRSYVGEGAGMVHGEEDIARLRKIAALACAYYGRRRSSMEVTLRRIVSTPTVGLLIKRLSGAVSPSIGTTVSSVAYNFEQFTTHIQTEFAELDLAAQGSPQILSPGQGLAGSMGRSLEARVGDMERRVGRLPDREALPTATADPVNRAIWVSFWATITDNANAPDYAFSGDTGESGEAAEVNGVLGIAEGTRVRVFKNPAGEPNYKFEYDSAGLLPMENFFDFIEVWPALVRTAADPIEAQVWIPGSPAPDCFPPLVADNYYLTPAETPVDVTFDKIGDGTFASGTLEPCLRNYAAGPPVVADWIQVRCQPGAFVTEIATTPIPPDGHTNTFFGTLADQPLPYSFTFEYEVAPGRFKRMYCDRDSVTPADGFKIALEGDGTGWVKARDKTWSVVLADCPPAGAVMRVRYIPVGQCKWSWVTIPKTIEGGTLLTTKSTLGQGWLFVDEDGKTAHADPRNEVIYRPKCGSAPALDARGHCLGWWAFEWTGEQNEWVWHSPWGFADPGGGPGG